MDLKRAGRLVSYLFVDGMLLFAFWMLLRIDWLVNNTLYSYDLKFSLDWAIPYWTFMRIIMASLSLVIAVVAVLYYSEYRRIKRLSKATIYLCKSCGNA